MHRLGVERYQTYVKGVTPIVWSGRITSFQVKVKHQGQIAQDVVLVGNRGEGHALQAANLMAIQFHLLLDKPLAAMVVAQRARSNSGIIGVHRKRKGGMYQLQVPGAEWGTKEVTYLPAHTDEATVELVRAVMYERAVQQRKIGTMAGTLGW